MAEGGNTANTKSSQSKKDNAADSSATAKQGQRKQREPSSASTPSQNQRARTAHGDHASLSEQKSKRKGKKDKGQMSNNEKEDETSGKDTEARITFLKEKCAELIQEGEYEEASTVLKEIRTLHDSNGLDTQLQTIECDLHSSNEMAESYILGVKDLLTESDTLTTDEVRRYSNQLDAEKHHIRAIILYRITVDMIKNEKVMPNDVISYMRERAFDIANAARALIEKGDRSREIGIEYGVRYSKEILAELRAVEDGDPANKADKEGKCLSTLAYLCITASLNEQAIHFAKEGLEVLDNEFGANASKHKAYGWLLNNLGTANHNACHYDVAEPYYVAAIKSYGNAVDFLTSEELKKELVLAKSNLGNSCKKLGKKTYID